MKRPHDERNHTAKRPECDAAESQSIALVVGISAAADSFSTHADVLVLY